jgi:hypothetical protein
MACLQWTWNIVSAINLGPAWSSQVHKIFWALRVSGASEHGTDTAAGHFAQGIRAHQVDLFYDISTGSEHDIFPFQLSGYRKGES